MRVDGQRHAPAALPPVKTRYPLHRRLGELQGRSGRVRKISPPPGFDPRTVQLVARRYADRAIPAHILNITIKKYVSNSSIYGQNMKSFNQVLTSIHYLRTANPRITRLIRSEKSSCTTKTRKVNN
jgi:hypothetical protein